MSVFGTPLSFTTITSVIDRMRPANQFLKNFLFSARVSLPTETIELSSESKGREMAPFVAKGAEGVFVGGWTEGFQTVQGPNIRIKRALNPHDTAFRVFPGTHKYENSGRQAIARARSMNLRVLSDYISNSEEWLVSQALQGVISYATAGQDVFTITFPSPAANNITLSTFWNDATPANVKFLENIHVVKQVANNEGFTMTDAILGSEASTAFRALVEGGHIKPLSLPNTFVSTGTATFTSQFNADGAIFLGELAGIRFWEYSRTVLMNGVATSLIRPKWVEFVSSDNTTSGRVLYYAAIPDMAAPGGLFQGERFAKEFAIDDPSSLVQLAHSRPLPVLRRPESKVSMKVVSG